jgi:hypothetical protein
VFSFADLYISCFASRPSSSSAPSSGGAAFAFSSALEKDLLQRFKGDSGRLAALKAETGR